MNFDRITHYFKKRKIEKFEKYINSKYNNVNFQIEYFSNSNAIYLRYIEVKTKNRGIGSKIIDELKIFAKRVQMKVYLIPDHNSDMYEKLIQFYQKCGFKFRNNDNMLEYDPT